MPGPPKENYRLLDEKVRIFKRSESVVWGDRHTDGRISTILRKPKLTLYEDNKGNNKIWVSDQTSECKVGQNFVPEGQKAKKKSIIWKKQNQLPTHWFPEPSKSPITWPLQNYLLGWWE